MFDAKAGTILQNQVIVIKGDVITDVGPRIACRFRPVRR
jgi:hypothetical protein